jgi:2-(1,2-epoxy-1,2-dihydrophenyl)acetyl-CoA isomerase
MMTTGRLVDAQEALRIGLVDRVVDAASLAAETARIAGAMASGPPSAIAAIKRSLTQSELNKLNAQIDLENENQIRAFESEDAAEGMASFFEKRRPRFTGK